MRDRSKTTQSRGREREREKNQRKVEQKKKALTRDGRKEAVQLLMIKGIQTIRMKTKWSDEKQN